MKSKIIFGLRFISFICVYFLVMILVDSIFPSNVEVEPSLIVIMALFAQILVNSTAIVYLLHRLRFKGVKQILFTSLIVYGIQIFMTQMETWIFIDAFPMFNKTELMKLFIGGLILSLLVTTIAFLIWKRNVSDNIIENNPINMSQWFWKIPILSIAYMLLYFLFGTIIAWRSEELRNFYATSVVDMNIVSLRIIQIFRGLLWIALCIPILLGHKGKKSEKVISLSLLLAILPTVLLLFPNPYMPEIVRLTHFIEVFISNGIFGIILTLTLSTNKNELLSKKHKQNKIENDNKSLKHDFSHRTN